MKADDPCEYCGLSEPAHGADCASHHLRATIDGLCVEQKELRSRLALADKVIDCVRDPEFWHPLVDDREIAIKKFRDALAEYDKAGEG